MEDVIIDYWSQPVVSPIIRLEDPAAAASLPSECLRFPISPNAIIKDKGGREWETICRPNARTEGAVDVVTRVANKADVSDQWVNGCIEWALGLLKKSGRSGKSDIFGCLDALLRR